MVRFWTAGSTAMGPTPAMGPRRSRKLQPTICPPSSATTPTKPGWASSIAQSPVAISTEGKSGGKLCASAIALNASYSIRPHAAASSGVARRSTMSMRILRKGQTDLVPSRASTHPSAPSAASTRDRPRIAAAPTATQATMADTDSTRPPRSGRASSPLRLVAPPPLLRLPAAVGPLRNGARETYHRARRARKGQLHELRDRHRGAAGFGRGVTEARAVGRAREQLVYRSAQRARAEAVNDAHLGETGAHGAVEEGGKGVDGLARPLPDEADLAGGCVAGGERDAHGASLPRGRALDGPELVRRHLEPQPTAVDARAGAHELHQLAADAASGHLDQLAHARRPRRPQRRVLVAPPRDLLFVSLDEARERRWLRSPAQLLEHGLPLGAQRAHEPSRLVERFGPVAALPFAEIGHERLGLGASSCARRSSSRATAPARSRLSPARIASAAASARSGRPSRRAIGSAKLCPTVW